jgi:hypothetical protein
MQKKTEARRQESGDRSQQLLVGTTRRVVRPSLLAALLLATVAHATPSSDLANQAAYLRNQAAAASQNLHVARQQLEAAEQRLANLQDKRTRQLEEWTTWNAGRCAVRGRLTLGEAQSQPCKPAPKMVYYEQRPTGPEIVTPNPQRPLVQRSVAESTAVVEQGRAQLAAIEARLARVNADYQQALAAEKLAAAAAASSSGSGLPTATPPVVSSSGSGLPTATPPLAESGSGLPTATAFVEVAVAEVTPPPTPAEPEETALLYRYRYWLVGGLLLVLTIAYRLTPNRS